MEIELHPIGIEQGNHYFLSLHSCRLAEISGLYCTCLVKYMALSSKKHKGIVVTKKMEIFLMTTMMRICMNAITTPYQAYMRIQQHGRQI